jgi:tol-pal system protein YbgF
MQGSSPNAKGIAMRPLSLLLSTALIATLLALPATAQEAMPEEHSIDSRAEFARTEVRFTALEERLRQLQGKIEEVEFENRRLRERLDLFQQDAEVRFGELESRPATTAASTSTESTEKKTVAETDPAPEKPTEKQVLKLPDEKTSEFESSRDHYNHAFRLLNQTQYDEAGDSFEDFIKRYPKDPLIGNAYYWAGETYYVRQNYAQSTDYFRRGYEALPEGPKAGDNLLKLAMSLANQKRTTEACVVLKQVTSKFADNSMSLRQKSEAERNRIGCK